jgi:lysyl-tRNA synthetase, class II
MCASMPDSIPALRAICDHHSIQYSKPQSLSHLVDKLVGHFIEPLCIQPTFITDHPKSLSPLAKNHSADSNLAEYAQRFELFIGGKEVCNAYTGM